MGRKPGHQSSVKGTYKREPCWNNITNTTDLVVKCWSFNGPEPGGPESTISKREKEAALPWFTWRASRVLFLGLALLHVGTGRPLEWVRAQCAFSRGSQSPGLHVRKS